MLTHCRNIIAPLIILCLLVACSSEPKMKEEWIAEQVGEEWFPEDVVTNTDVAMSMSDQIMPSPKSKTAGRFTTTSEGILTTLNPSAANRKLIKNASVSYTHLTLPTIYSV